MLTSAHPCQRTHISDSRPCIHTTPISVLNIATLKPSAPTSTSSRSEILASTFQTAGLEYRIPRPIPNRDRRLRRFRKDKHKHSCPQKLGWQASQQCGGDGSKGHDHPKTCIGTSFFPGPYNPALCTVYAEVQNAINQKPPFWGKWIAILTGTYNPLKFVFFNNYTLKKNGKPLGTYCGLYSQQYSGGEATYVPSW